MSTKVSVITVSYNSAETIARTIDSVLSQKSINVEYIVVDGGSSDGTVSILRQFEPKLHHLLIEPDEGMYDAINKGLNLASGDIISILNSDDVYVSENVLSSVVSEFQRSSSIGTVLADVEMCNSVSRTKGRKVSCRYWVPQMLRLGWMPPHPGMFVKAQLYRTLGGFSTSYSIAADYEFAVRCFLVHQIKFSKLDSVVVQMEIGGVSTSGLAANKIITGEIQKAFTDNGMKTFWSLLMLRFPIKFLMEVVVFQLRQHGARILKRA